MVDVTDKPVTARRAAAEGRIRCQAATLALVREGRAPKGSVVQTAELAGVMAAKRTGDLIPLCHPLPLTGIDVTIATNDQLPGFDVRAEVWTSGPDRKSTRLNSSHYCATRMPSYA